MIATFIYVQTCRSIYHQVSRTNNYLSLANKNVNYTPFVRKVLEYFLCLVESTALGLATIINEKVKTFRLVIIVISEYTGTG